MRVFEGFTSLCTDFSVCRTAFLDAHERTKDILGAVKNRLEVERAQTAERIAALEQQQGDPARSETVRRMAALELDQLQARTYAVTTDEQATFAEAVNDAETAVRDMRRLQSEIRQAFDDLNAELKRLRAETLGNQSVELYGRWTEGVRRDFTRLGGGPQ